jgi:hypothetical protein
MNKKYIKFLWDICHPVNYGYPFGGPPTSYATDAFILKGDLLQIPQLEWADWMERRVVHSPFEVQASCPEHEVFGLAKIDKSLESFGPGTFSIQPEKPVEQDFNDWMDLLIRGEAPKLNVTVYKVDVEKLVRYLSIQWGLTGTQNFVKPEGFQIGIKDGLEPVVILDHQDKNVVSQVSEIKEYLAAKKLFVLINCEREFAADEREQELMFGKGVTYLTFDEFLTEDGMPRWFYKIDGKIVEMPLGISLGYDEVGRAYRFTGKPIKLTESERDIFSMLIRHSGSVVSYETLESLGFSKDTLRKHFSNMKNALPDLLKPCLDNRKNRGYIFDPSEFIPK